MVEITSGGVRPQGLIEPEEWIKIMRQILRVIEKQLAHLESRANRAGTTGAGAKAAADGRPFETGDVRALKALSDAVGQVRILNSNIEEDKLSEDAKQHLREGREKQDEFQRRLARLSADGEEG